LLSLSVFAEAEFVFSIYDCDGKNTIDAFDVGNCLRALNLNPTLELIGKMGGTTKRGEKKLSLDEFLPIFGQVC
jgi:myosin light chain 6